MTTAGRLKNRVQIERRSAKSGGRADGDRFGRSSGGWVAAFGPRWAGVGDRTGRETLQGRLEGRRPVEVVLRRDPETTTITVADRCVVLAEAMSPAVYLNIKSVADLPSDPDAFLLLTCEAGGANG